MWLDVISYLTSYAIIELWGVMLFYYALSHGIWAVYFKYQGSYDWYLALLPFKLQFMKMELCYEDNKLPIIYIILCFVCSCFFPLWLIPVILSTIMSRKFYACMCESANANVLAFMPLAGKLYMLMEVISNERDGTE